jgi:hypothetical protein
MANSELAEEKIQKTLYYLRAYYPLWGLTPELLESHGYRLLLPVQF